MYRRGNVHSTIYPATISHAITEGLGAGLQQVLLSKSQ